MSLNTREVTLVGAASMGVNAVTSTVDNLRHAGNLALLKYAKEGDLAGVRGAIVDGANPNAMDIHGHSVLFLAADNDHADVIKELTARGNVDVNAACGFKGTTALMAAAKRGYSSAVAALMDHNSKANPNAQDNLGCSALFYACKAGNVHVVRALINNPMKTKINGNAGTPEVKNYLWCCFTDYAAETCLTAAFRAGHNREIIDLLLEEADARVTGAAIVAAAETGDVNLLKLLFKACTRAGRVRPDAKEWARAADRAASRLSDPNVIEPIRQVLLDNGGFK